MHIRQVSSRAHSRRQGVVNSGEYVPVSPLFPSLQLLPRASVSQPVPKRNCQTSVLLAAI